MKIFISWSKHNSMLFAIKTKELLEKLMPDSHVFMSQVDILGGEDVQLKIIENIRECDKLILCFTKENKKSPWLLFEAGFARGLGKTVIPILFDEDYAWHSWIDNPMNVARELKVTKKEFSTTLCQSLDIIQDDNTRGLLTKYIKEITEIKLVNIQVDTNCLDLVETIAERPKFAVKSPYFEKKTAFYLTGFETFDLYEIIIDAFMNTGKALWIYGRKNTKLVNGHFRYLFEYLQEKTSNHTLKGSDIDFRCLFLDPTSQEVKKAHIHQDSFKTELDMTIMRVKRAVSDNKNLQRCFKYYNNKRTEIIIRSDDSILYSKPLFDENGFPQHISNSKFQIFSVDSEKGKDCVSKFEEVWNHGRNLFT